MSSSAVPTGYPAPNSPPTGVMPPTVHAAVERTKLYYGGQGQPAKGPDNPSADYTAMLPIWKKVTTFDGGVDQMRKSAKDYIPKFPMEDDGDYKTRIEAAPFTNVWEDIASGLAGKPFSREVQFEDPDEVDERFKDLYEDIDGRGNNLHVFAEEWFREGLDYAIDWVLVDYTKLPPLSPGRFRSVAEEQALGARPYWVRIAAINVKAVYSNMVNGKEVLTYFRYYEPVTIRDGFEEKVAERYREYSREPIVDPNSGQTVDYTPAAWRVLEKKKDEQGREYWAVLDEGTIPIGRIPLIPFCIAKRRGNGWAVRHPLKSLIDMQMDAFLQECNLRNMEMLTCYPMLTANGVAQPTEQNPEPGQQAKPIKVPVGPRAVLWAPPNPAGGQPGSWNFIEPSGESYRNLQAKLETSWKNMREIGMQPLAESNITVITSANVSVKAKSALQAWALRFKDALEQAFVLTALWLGKSEDEAPGLDVYKDFGVDLQGGEVVDNLLKAQEQGQLSGETLRAEMKRRNILSENFNEEDEVERIANEMVSMTEDGIDPVTGQPLDEEPEPDGDPADPAAFDSADDIDDKTIAGLFS